MINDKVMKEETKKVINELAYQVYHAGYVDGKEDDCEKLNAYQTGLEDAWECARRIVLDEYENSISGFDLCNIFETANYNHILKTYSVSEAMAKIEEYDKHHNSNELKVGDEVMNKETTAVVLSVNADGFFTCINKTGSVYMYQDPTLWTKTNRRYSQIVVTPGGEVNANE